jgi:hypothetical protein
LARSAPKNAFKQQTKKQATEVNTPIATKCLIAIAVDVARSMMSARVIGLLIPRHIQ